MLKKRSSERIQYLNAGEESSGTLFDLSEGGVSCYYSTMLGTGAFVKVTVERVELDAKVVFCAERTNGSRLGLQFWNVPREKQSELKALVDSFSRGVPLKCSIDVISSRPEKK